MDKVEFFKDTSGSVRFYLTLDEVEEHYACFTVYEVNQWYMDNTYDEGEPCLEGSIKWDGCANIQFLGMQYKHFCGKRYIVEYGQMLIELFQTVTSYIGGYDKEIGEG